MNSRLHTKYLALGLAGAGGLTAAGIALAAGGPLIKPNPIVFSGAGLKPVVIKNTGPAARYQVSIDQPGTAFSLVGASRCGAVGAGRVCRLKISYKPTGASEDDATLQVRSRIGGPSQQGSAKIIGRPGGGGGGGGGGNGPNCTLQAARHQKLVVSKSKRNPFQVALLQDQDGTVSASASGKTAAGKRISLTSLSAPATAGNGVVLKLKLGSKSEGLIRAELAAGRAVKMNLRGTCSSDSGSSSQSAVIHFSDAKSGKGFKLPLEADPRPR